jgi:hypothetical protein
MAEESNTGLWVRHREAILLVVASAIAGAAASKLLDASLPVLLGLAVALLFGSLVVTLVWLRRDAREARTLVSGMSTPLARAEARLAEVNELGVLYGLLKDRVSVLEDEESMIEALTVPRPLAMTIFSAQNHGWRVRGGGLLAWPGMLVFEHKERGETLSIEVPLPTEEARRNVLLARLAEALGITAEAHARQEQTVKRITAD